MLPPLSECLDCVEKVTLCFFVAIDYGLLWILWENSILDDKLVEVVSQEVRACVSTMSVENSEEAAFWPIGDVFLGRWLHYVEDDADSILVIVPDDSLVRVGSIPHDVAIFSDTALRRLPTRKV